jgi:UPF0755 protein
VKKALSTIVGLLILIVTLLFLSAGLSLTLPSPLKVPEKVLDIPKGTGFLGIVDFLAREGVIRGRLGFSLLAIAQGKARKMQAGEYLFKNSMYPDEILSKLATGDELFHTFTIPEGYTLSQVAKVIEEAGLVKEWQFIDKARDTSFLSSLAIKGSSAEGYLYPDTYRFRKSTRPEEILKAMVDRFSRVYREVCNEKRVQTMGHTREEIVILASMVEKEAGVPWEKPLIAAVFENRLKNKMKLQSDPTVIYGLTNFNGDLTREHLNKDTPFNTYRFIGLPPEPIANPGKDSIVAVLYPARVNYLYFVSRNDGTHYFSTTLQEHNRAVKRYQNRLKTAGIINTGTEVEGSNGQGGE